MSDRPERRVTIDFVGHRAANFLLSRLGPDMMKLQSDMIEVMSSPNDRQLSSTASHIVVAVSHSGKYLGQIDLIEASFSLMRLGDGNTLFMEGIAPYDAFEGPNRIFGLIGTTRLSFFIKDSESFVADIYIRGPGVALPALPKTGNDDDGESSEEFYKSMLRRDSSGIPFIDLFSETGRGNILFAAPVVGKRAFPDDDFPPWDWADTAEYKEARVPKFATM